MGASFNKVILAGNLTRDPELRYTPSGTAIAAFGLAVNRKWKDQNGETKEDVTFIDVTAFGKQAELLGQYCKKGSALLVEGRLKLDQWEDKQTQQKRSKLGVVLERMTFLGGDRAEQTERPTPRTAKPEPSPGPSDDLPPEEDDVPF